MSSSEAARSYRGGLGGSPQARAAATTRMGRRRFPPPATPCSTASASAAGSRVLAPATARSSARSTFPRSTPRYAARSNAGGIAPARASTSTPPAAGGWKADGDTLRLVDRQRPGLGGRALAQQLLDAQLGAGQDAL